VVLGVVVANRSGDHSRRTRRAWRHSSEALNRLLRGSFRLTRAAHDLDRPFR
jgi:hypothetical protein